VGFYLYLDAIAGEGHLRVIHVDGAGRDRGPFEVISAIWAIKKLALQGALQGRTAHFKLAGMG
jgi:hypothetical protein